MASLKETIASDVSSVFLNTNDFAENVLHYPGDDRDRGADVVAVVSMDHEEGTNEISGDGADLNDRHGERERRTAILEVPATLTVNDGDSFKIRGEFWFVKRDTGRDKDAGQDEGLQSVRVINTKGRHTRQPRLRPTVQFNTK